MNCKVCGRELNDVLFCTYCGTSVDVENPQGRNMEEMDLPFQSYLKPQTQQDPELYQKYENVNWGQPTEPLNTVPVNYAANDNQTIAQPQAKNNIALIIVICVLAFLLMVTVAVIGVVVYNGKSVPADSGQTAQQTTVAEVAPSQEMPPVAVPSEQKPEQESGKSFPRISTYSPHYTYKNMSEIHNSYEATDSEAIMMANFIAGFNSQWLAFINDGSTEVYRYLKPGTPPYSYAQSYGRKNIREDYILMETTDVRKLGSTYYVWTHEIIDMLYFDTGKTTREEYRWVYKVTQSGGGYYVENYIRDPAFK